MKWNYKKRVNVGVSIFLVWVLVQFFRASFGYEPYPAAYLPGFGGNGNESISSRELYVKKGDEYRLLSHYDTHFGHSRFRKLLKQLTVAIETEDSVKIRKQLNGVRSIRHLKKGDSVYIRDVKWSLLNGEYVQETESKYKIRL